MRNYLILLTLWGLCWWLPQLAGDWYDDAFPIYQSSVSLILLISARHLVKGWYVPEFLVLCVINILHNVGDAIFNFEPSHYSDIQTVLNTLEIAVLLGLGGPTEVIKALRHGRSGHNSDPDDRHLPLDRRNAGSA